MCVDYTGLNKACPKDHFPLPRIDQIVDSTSGCEILSFLDAYSSYHQIVMKESDQFTTSFITPYGSYYKQEINLVIAVYVDDIVVRIAQACDLIANLAATFMNLRRFCVKLNPKNVFLGSQRGSCSDTLCSNATSKPTPKKSRPSPTWAQYVMSRAYRGSPVVGPP